jgi:hypothetical protein
MASKAQQLPSHYEVLGLSPAASQDDIARAFARAMSMFGVRPVAVVAHISQAFEILRNPEKRRLYDRSIGVEPKQQPYQWRLSIAPQPPAPFITAERAVLPELGGSEEDYPSLLPDAQDADAKLSALIRSLHALAEPTVRPRPTAPIPPPEVQRQPRKAPDDCAVRSVEYVLPIRQANKALQRTTDHPFDWRRPVLTLGGLVLGAGLIGTVAGLSIPTDPQAAVTAPRPPVKALASAAMKPPGEPAASVADEVREQDLSAPRRPASVSRFKRSSAHGQPAYHAKPEPTDAQLAGAAGPVEDVESAADPLAPEAVAPRPVAAKLPLPKSVIARTIAKIGYACGSVSSLAPIEGAPGAFKVTCASGYSYRAAPVGGRYHFRRL